VLIGMLEVKGHIVLIEMYANGRRTHLRPYKKYILNQHQQLSRYSHVRLPVSVSA